MRKYLFFLLAIALINFGGPTQPILAADDAFVPSKNPDPFIAKYYRDNKTKIAELETIVREKKSTEERLKALKTLNQQFPDASIRVLVDAVSDKDEAVASFAAERLGTASMMMNHTIYGDPDAHIENPNLAYMMQKHDLIFTALRKTVSDKRQSVRDPVAAIISSQGDEKGLENLAAAKAENLYSDEQYVQFLLLAGPEPAGKYLQSYLTSSDVNLQTLASGCLAESATYGPLVKEKVLFNPKAPVEARIAAAQKMSAADSLLPLFISPNTPSKLYSEAMHSYVGKAGKNFSESQIDLLLDGVKEKLTIERSELLEHVEQNLKKLKVDKLEG